MKNGTLEKQIRDSILPAEKKEKLEAIIRGERLADLYYDAIAKRIFSPDIHPERLDFILQRIMKDKDVCTDKSASNEPYLQNFYAKKTITDIAAWLSDERALDVEIQKVAQEYIFDRTEIYSSNMLLVQYSAESGQYKSKR